MQTGVVTMEKIEGSLETSKIKLSYDPTIPLPGIHPKKMKSVSRTANSSPVFIAALHTRAKAWG